MTQHNLTTEDMSEVLLRTPTVPLRLSEILHNINSKDDLARVKRERAAGARLVVDGNATYLGLARTERGALRVMQASDAAIHDEEVRLHGRRGPLASCPRPRLADYEAHLLRGAYAVIPRRRTSAPSTAALDNAAAV